MRSGLLILLGLLLVVAAIVGAIASSKSGWQFERTEVDVGELEVGSEILVRFPVRNRGWRVTRFAGNTPAGCGIEGCVEIVDSPELLGPGDSGEVVVKYTARFVGDHTKSFDVYTAGESLKTHTLRIHCKVHGPPDGDR